MKPIFSEPFNKRRYPSPRTGRYVMAYVKEVPLEDFPSKFVKANMASAHESNYTLFEGAVGGMRAWRVDDISNMVMLTNFLRETPWSEVWQIDTTEPEAVLDLLKYTTFYDDKTMDRYEEFDQISLPLMKHHYGVVTQACEGGVSIFFRDLSSVDDWNEIADSVWRFNKKYFTCEATTQSSFLKSFKKSSSLWFGHM